MKLNNLKKFSALVLTLALLMILTACRFYELILQIESIEVVTIENAKTTYIQGEELNLEEFEITVNFGDDRTSTFTAAEDGVSSVYLADPFVDMHFEAGQRIINQEVYFYYKNLKTNSINIKTIRKDVESVNVISSPNSKYNYFVGERFDVADFEVFIAYADGTTAILPLQEEMVDLDDLNLVNYLGNVSFKVYYNGVASQNSVTISVNKQQRVINDSLIKIIDKGLDFINLEEIENANYAISISNNPNNLIWTNNNSFDNLSFDTTYYLFIRILENDYYFESNIVSVSVTTTNMPDLISVTETTAEFLLMGNFEITLRDPLAFTIPIIGVVNDGRVVFNNLEPNKTYRLLLNDQIAGELTTKEANNPFLYNTIQTHFYDGDVKSFEVRFKEKFIHLSDYEITFEYFSVDLGEVVANPVDAGNYRVTVIHPYGNKINNAGVLTIRRPHLQVRVDDVSKEYFSSDPDYSFSVISGELHEFDLDELIVNYFRDEDESIGRHTVYADFYHPNYTFRVVPGNLYIRKAKIDAYLDDLSIIYGDDDYEFSYTLSGNGLEYHDGHLDILNVYYSIDYAGNNKLIVGEYNVDFIIESRFYEITTHSNKLTVNKKELLVIPNEVIKTYGEADPELSYDLEGLVIGDTNDEVVGQLLREAGNDVNIYNYDISSLEANNYLLILDENNKFEIKKRLVDVVITNDIEITYGSSYADLLVNYELPNLEFAYNDFEKFKLEVVNSDLDVGEYLLDIKYDLSDVNNNYEISININNRKLNVIPYEVLLNKEFYLTYNGKNQINDFNNLLAEYINNNDLLLLDDQVDSINLLTSSLNITYFNTAGYEVSSLINLGNNYTLSLESSVVYNVDKLLIDITYSGYNDLVYGEEYNITANSNGLVSTDYLVLSNHQNIDAGNYNTTISVINEDYTDITSSYEITNPVLSYNINKRELRVSVSNLSKEYGSDDPVITYTNLSIDGLVFDDEINNVLTGLDNIGRVNGNNVGNYLFIDNGLIVNQNYNLVFEEIGKLTINPMEIELTYTGNYDDLTYGDLPNIEVSSDRILPYGDTLKLYNHLEKLVNTYDTHIKVYNNEVDVTNNYIISNDVLTYTIKPKELTVVINNQVADFGSNISDLLTNYTNQVTADDLEFDDSLTDLGEITYGTDANSESTVGEYIIYVVSGYNNPNYTYTYVDGILTIKETEILLDYSSDDLNKTYNNSFDEIEFRAKDLFGNFIDDLELVITYYDINDIDKTIPVTPINAGRYTIHIYWEGDNRYAEYTNSALVLVISKLTINVDEEITYTYNNTNYQDMYISDLNNIINNKYLLSGDSDLFSISNIDLTNANEYDLTESITGNNYVISNDSKIKLIIEKAELIITPKENQSKIYGNDDPILSYDVSGLFNGDSLSILVGQLSREDGNDVGGYLITQGTLSLDTNQGNYYITFTSDVEFKVNKRDISLTIDSNSKVYGNDDPEFSYTLSDEQFSEELAIVLMRESGNDVGVYSIEVSTINDKNFNVNINTGNLEIYKALITVTPNSDQFKHYGDGDPEITYVVSGLAYDDVAEDVIDITLTRVSGENAGTYKIVEDEIVLTSGNYEYVLTDGKLFEIKAREIQLTINDKSKVYGQDDPIFDYHLSEEEYRAELDILLERVSGEDVGKYNISLDSYNDDNIILTVTTNGELTITPKTLIVTPVANSKVYGDEDPVFSYSVRGYEFDDKNLLNGSLSRAFGDDVGDYQIQVGSLTVDSNNYVVEVVEGINLVITPRPIIITIYDVSKLYGEEDPDFSFTLSENEYQSEFDIKFGREPGEDVGIYEISIIELGTNNFTVTEVKGTLTIEKITPVLLGNDISVNGFAVYSLNYDNSMTTFALANSNFQALVNDHNVISDFEVSFSQSTFDLSNGGTTFVVDVDLVSNNPNFNNLSTKVVYKFKSVTIGNNENYMTIEDALNIATSGTIIAKYNTSFASSDVSEIVYNGSVHIVNSNVTLLVPNTNAYSTSLDQRNNDGLRSTKSLPYSRLFMPSDLELIIEGTMTVNATRSTGGATQFMGFVDYNAYSIFELSADSNVFIYGTYNSLGFTIGEGILEAMAGSTVREPLLIKSFRGGNATLSVNSSVFPFNQFTSNNIETLLIINTNAKYELFSLVYVRGHLSGSLPLIGDTNSYLMNINEGRVIKSYDENTATVNISIEGNVEINPVSVTIYVTASSSNKDLPFDGGWSFVVRDSSTLSIKSGAWLGFLPGSELEIEENAVVNIENNAKVSIVPTNTVNDYSAYPNNFTSYYRTPPQTNFNINTPVRTLINGIINVHSGGTLAGDVEIGSSGQVNMVLGSLHTHNYRYVSGNGGSNITSVDIKLPVESFSDYAKGIDEYDNDVIFITETIRYSGIPTVGINVLFSTIYGDFNGVTNSEGKATIAIPFDSNWVENEKIVIYISYTTDYGLYYEKVYDFINQTYVINTTTSPEGNISSDGGTVEITIELLDGYSKLPLSDIQIEITSNVNWIKLPDGPYSTDLNGKYSLNLTISEKTSSGNRTGIVNIEVTSSGVTKSIEVSITQNGTSSSPFLYSIDSEGNLHFEHEPISLSMLKTLESSTYGTLRLLEDIDGTYYIQVVEEGSSVTMLNGVNLFYFDYEENSELIDFFIDVYGNPHSIKERIKPTSFVDHNNVSYLNEVLEKDGNYASLVESSRDPLAYYYMTFNRLNSNNAKFMISLQDNSINEGYNTTDIYHGLLSSFNANQNLWWFEQILMNNSNDANLVKNLFDSLLVNVEVWDGQNWIYKGSIERGSYLLEEFLLVLDLEGINTEDLHIRLQLPGRAHYIIDSVSVDYSENINFTYGVMTLESAILNGLENVYSLVIDGNDNTYVSLAYKDAVEFGFKAPELQSGYTRKFGVKVSGYIYPSNVELYDELQELMEGKSYEEIKQIIIDSGRQELIDDIPLVEEFYYTILHIGSQDLETILEILFEIPETSEDD